MHNALSPRPDNRPPQREDWGTGVAISVVAHLSLIAALVWGLHWRSSTQVESASAELWAAVPDAAAPPPVDEPPPPPPPAPKPVVETPPPPPVETIRPPDIVTEQVPEKKPPPKPKPPPPSPPPPAPAPRPAPAPPPAPKDKLDAKALQKLHDDTLKRMLGQMDAPATDTGRAARSAGPSANWGGLIAAAISRSLSQIYTGSMDGVRPPEIHLRLAADGTILSQTISRSSGNALYDDAVLKAVIATRKLPRDTDGSIPDTDVTLTFKP